MRVYSRVDGIRSFVYTHSQFLCVILANLCSPSVLGSSLRACLTRGRAFLPVKLSCASKRERFCRKTCNIHVGLHTGDNFHDFPGGHLKASLDNGGIGLN